MKLTKEKELSLPDFFALYERYRTQGNGPRADLRRVRDVDSVADLPAYYRWLDGLQPSEGLQRFAFLLPYVRHRSQISVGRALRKAGIGEMRMFQVLRSQPPRDLEQFRRLCQQASPLTVDVGQLGRALWYWQRADKQRVLRDYLITDASNDENEQGVNTP